MPDYIDVSNIIKIRTAGIKEIRIEESKDDGMYRRQKGGILIIKVPKDRYAETSKIAEEMNEKLNPVKQFIEDEMEEDRVIAMVNKHANEVRKKQAEEAQTAKRTIASKPNKTANQKYKGSKKNRMAALIAALIFAGTIGLGTVAINRTKEYNQVAASVEDKTEEEIKQEIEDILKGEVSAATGKDEEEIRFSREPIGSYAIRTKVIAGEDTYVYDTDLKSFTDFPGTLKGSGIRNIIGETKAAGDDRKALIRALRDARKFSENKDLEVDGKNLKEVKAKKEEKEER